MDSSQYYVFILKGTNHNYSGTATTPINTRDFFSTLAVEGYTLPPQFEEELARGGSSPRFPKEGFALRGFEDNIGKRPEDLVSRLQEHEGIVLEYQGTVENFRKNLSSAVGGD